MDRLAHPSGASSLEYIAGAKLARTAPRPVTVEDTGLSLPFLADLTAKHLLDSGVLTANALSGRLALAGAIMEKILNFMRAEGYTEVRSRAGFEGALRYGLTERGRMHALDAAARSGYVGAAPVPLKDYAKMVRKQSVRAYRVTRDAMRAAFKDVVLQPSLLDQLGPSLNSGRAIFIYGPAGTGKTYISQRLARLFYDLALIPRAIAVEESVIPVFDPLLHKAVRGKEDESQLLLEDVADPRYVTCERPVVISGGELSSDMLEVHFDPATKEYGAPLQLKANNGMFIIDDMGRQRITPAALFNRWIVPMEERVDYLSLGSGRHFTVPFEVILVFSTNIHPLELADEAFLRRIGYKIEFKPISEEEYVAIWRNTCRENGIVFDPSVVKYAIKALHDPEEVPLLPCHPRDLLGIAVDRAEYFDNPRQVTAEDVRWAWQNYFVNLNTPATAPSFESNS